MGLSAENYESAGLAYEPFLIAAGLWPAKDSRTRGTDAE